MAGVELAKISGEAFRFQRDLGNGESVPVGSHLVYARIRREGGGAGRRGGSVVIPRRRYLGYQAEWPDRFMRTSELRRLFT